MRKSPTWAALALCATLVLRAQPAGQSPPRPNFAQDVAPILREHCLVCHHTGGGAPFSLVDFSDARKHAAEVAEATRSRHMPPWLPESGYGDFEGEHRLSEAQIGLISKWVRDGAPEGPRAELAAAPEFEDGWQLGKPDLIVDAPAAITVPATGRDVFWNFILTPQLTAPRYVRAIEIRTGNNRIVHHANMLIDSARSARAHESSPGAGFPGMDLTLERTALDFDSHFLFWKPGGVPYSEPDGLSWRLDPGADLVLNTHIKPDGKPEQLRPSVGLYFTSKPPARFPLLVQLTGDDALNIPPGVRDFTVADSFELPVDVDVLAVYPHAHYLGKLLEGFAILPGGARKWLIRIPQWDQDCQAVYRYSQPVFLPRGSVVSMRYQFDNSAANPNNPNHPPKRVRGGNQATDEMAHLWLQLLPRGMGDGRPAIEEALMRHRIQKNPADFFAHLRLGGLLLATMNARDAEPVLAAAVRLDPKHPEARNLLGASLAASGRTADAIGEFQLALEARPDYPNARLNLANALARSGRFDEAIENYQKILVEYPDDEVTKDRLAKTLAARSKQGLTH
jgi:Tfp pilus assembly protein PilF/mono/diheme cytochrome c family protein